MSNFESSTTRNDNGDGVFTGYLNLNATIQNCSRNAGVSQKVKTNAVSLTDSTWLLSTGEIVKISAKGNYTLIGRNSNTLIGN